MCMIATDMHAISPFPLHERGVWRLSTCVRLINDTSPTNEILHHDAALATVTIFKTNDDHAVALKAATPAIEAVFGGDAPRSDESRVAGCADVVVARQGVGHAAGTREAVVAA